jgi:hypothetical protein
LISAASAQSSAATRAVFGLFRHLRQSAEQALKAGDAVFVRVTCLGQGNSPRTEVGGIEFGN